MYKVLFVDDDIKTLKGYKRLLGKYFNVITAQTGEEALRIVKSNNDISVVVSDYSMPNMNGVELLEKIKSILPNVVRIIITGRANLDMAIELVNKANIYRFLTKPHCSSELKSTIIQASEKYYNDIIHRKISNNNKIENIEYNELLNDEKYIEGLALINMAKSSFNNQSYDNAFSALEKARINFIKSSDNMQAARSILLKASFLLELYSKDKRDNKEEIGKKVSEGLNYIKYDISNMKTIFYKEKAIF